MTNQFRLAGTLLSIGGLLYLLSFGPEAFGLVTLEREGQVVNLPLSIFFVSLGVVAAVLLVIGLWRIRKSILTERRIARVGLYLCITSVACIGLTAAGTIVAQVQSGRSADIFFIFLLLGFPLSIIGSLLLGVGVRHVRWLGWGRLFPFTVAGGTVLAFMDVNPVHDIGLTILALSWAAFGVSMLLRKPQ